MRLDDSYVGLTQWDTGRKIMLDQNELCDQVHFSNKSFGKTVDVKVYQLNNSYVADIPDELLQSPSPLTAYCYIVRDDGETTTISETFPVRKRNKPTEYIYNPDDQTRIKEFNDFVDDTIDEMNEIKDSLQYYDNKHVSPSDESYFTVSDDGTEITGLTDDGKSQENLVVPYKINDIYITSIGKHAFNVDYSSNNNILKSVILPNSITTIKAGAFQKCIKLLNVNIPNYIAVISDSMFAECSSLENITLPDSIKYIDERAFYGCSSLTHIIIPKNTINIWGYAFSGCKSLKHVEIPNSVAYLDRDAFSGCSNLMSIELPNSIGRINQDLFYGCTYLRTIEIPNSVEYIGRRAFGYCSSLRAIKIPDFVTSIHDEAFNGITPSNLTVYCKQGSYAENYANEKGFNVVYTDVSDISTTEELEILQYYGDTNIVPSAESYFIVSEDGTSIIGLTDDGKAQTELVIPYKINGETITSMRLSSDSGENNTITSIVLPNSIVRISLFAFRGFTALTSINVPNSVTFIGGHAFRQCTSLANITIPNSVTSIGDYAFWKCPITSIEIPDTVTTIGFGLFSYCSNLIYAKLPNNINLIPTYAFQYCISLEVVKIPNLATQIGDNAFVSCKNLKKIEIPTPVTNISSTAFKNITASQLTVYCEQGSYAETYAKEKGFNVVYTDIQDECIVGKKTTGEIFNDYTNNVAQAPYSHAEGYNTTVECYMGYMITDWGDETSKTYTLTSVDGLAVGDVISISYIELGAYVKDFSTITAIDETNKTITVDTYDPQFGDFSAIIFVKNKPTVGDTKSIYSGHAEGRSTVAYGEAAHAEGDQTTADNTAAHAEGAGSTASGESSHAEGGNTTASGHFSHAEGWENIANGDGAHAEGSLTTASGEASHAEGGRTTASGKYAHAEGWLTTAAGRHSHAEGRDNVAAKEFQHVQGKYCIEDITEDGYAHIVGNGVYGAPSNAHTLDWKGNAWFAGNVSIGGTYNTTTGKYDNTKELATKEEVNSAISDAINNYDTEAMALLGGD